MTTTLETRDFTNLSIPTDLGAFSIAELRVLDDDVDAQTALANQAANAAAVARVTEEMGDTARTIRDMAGLLLAEPYQSVQRPYDAAMARIAKALESGKITPAQANERRAKASIERAKGRAALGDDCIMPIKIYQDVIGISRGLFARTLQRSAQQLPTVREFVSRHPIYPGDDQPVTLEHVAEIGREKRDECVMYDAINLDARKIRDAAGAVLLNGDRKRGIKAMSNADFARLTKLTTARVAQIRYGGR